MAIQSQASKSSKKSSIWVLGAFGSSAVSDGSGGACIVGFSRGKRVNREKHELTKDEGRDLWSDTYLVFLTTLPDGLVSLSAAEQLLLGIVP